MKSKENQLNVVNPEATTVHGKIGIDDKRSEEIRKEVTALLEDNRELSHGEALCLIYNNYEKRAECAYAVYMLAPTEAGVEIHERFKLPKAEVDEVVAGADKDK